MIRGMGRRLMLAGILGVLVFAGFGLYADLGELQRNLARFTWAYLPLALGLVLVNYAVRFLRWQYYLRVIGLRDIPARGSARIFLAGFVMSVTPGKFGELIKAYFLKQDYGAPIARTAPVVVAERLTDFIALVLLCCVGILAFDYGTVVIAVAGSLSVLAVVLISSRRLAHWCIDLSRRVPGVRRFSDKLLEMYDSMAVLVRPGPLLVATLLGVVGWLAECVAFWVVCLGLGEATGGVGLTLAIFIHAFATIFGALTMLPGGLGTTEGSMTGLLVLLGKVAQAPAVAATLLVRLSTLWFGVAIGVVAMLRGRGAVSAEPQLPLAPEPPTGE